MAKVAPPDKRPMLVRNPTLLRVIIGCMQHPDGVACAEFEDGETRARFHLAGFAMEMIAEPEFRCADCNRADGRCEYASETLMKHMVGVGYTVEQVHKHGRELMQPSINARNAVER